MPLGAFLVRRPCTFWWFRRRGCRRQRHWRRRMPQLRVLWRRWQLWRGAGCRGCRALGDGHLQLHSGLAVARPAADEVALPRRGERNGGGAAVVVRNGVGRGARFVVVAGHFKDVVARAVLECCIVFVHTKEMSGILHIFCCLMRLVGHMQLHTYTTDDLLKVSPGANAWAETQDL